MSPFFNKSSNVTRSQKLTYFYQLAMRQPPFPQNMLLIGSFSTQTASEIRLCVLAYFSSKQLLTEFF
ncbi:hypothetical protein L596_024171 [Steinernema carpocapsae]|uniref:Uncharacterized protein n=1 Tax=Steinernema carpocapsae TaxID=34508 RepID=A0A4U5MFX8_STECR|nr:hypothetical protein L596_024171 [Steinernema carpocapsae]